MFNTGHDFGYRFCRSMLLVLVALSLSACTSMQERAQNMVDDVRRGLTYGFPYEGPAHDVATVDPADMDTMAAFMSHGSVDVYSLDSPSPGITPQRGGAGLLEETGRFGTGVPSARESSVLIYSLDGVSKPSQYVTLATGSLSKTTPAYQSPYLSSYESSYKPSYESSYQSLYESSYQPSYESSYQPSYETSYQPSYQSSYSTSSVPLAPARIYFNHGQSSVNRDGMEVIDHMVQGQSIYPEGVIRVEGHASARAENKDPVERNLANLKISMKRALNVSRALIRKGVPSSSIQTVAFGDSRPAASAIDNMEAVDRRVEIFRSSY